MTEVVLKLNVENHQLQQMVYRLKRENLELRKKNEDKSVFIKFNNFDIILLRQQQEEIYELQQELQDKNIYNLELQQKLTDREKIILRFDRLIKQITKLNKENLSISYDQIQDQSISHIHYTQKQTKKKEIKKAINYEKLSNVLKQYHEVDLQKLKFPQIKQRLNSEYVVSVPKSSLKRLHENEVIQIIKDKQSQ